ALAAGLAVAGAAWADMPVDGGVDLQPAATPIMEEIHAFHNFILPIIFGVSIFVLVLLVWVIVRYNRRANPTPRRFTHNMLVEVIWTVVPVLILVAIAWRSFPLLFHEERVPPSEITIKVTGNSWFWQYEYEGMGVNVTSLLLPQAEAQAQGRPWLLAVDNPIYVPTHANVRLLITSNDVIHSWAMPSFGVKADAIQGRVHDTWFNVEREGVFYGQCSELCGIDHAYMPIEVRAVSRAAFNQWVAAQGGTLASAAPANPGAPAAPAAAPAAAPGHTPAR
ncbi:MAG: cytochrome c oxidase subunit II, partial [Hyphomonadaceae bacterium]